MKKIIYSLVFGGLCFVGFHTCSATLTPASEALVAKLITRVEGTNAFLGILLKEGGKFDQIVKGTISDEHAIETFLQNKVALNLKNAAEKLDVTK